MRKQKADEGGADEARAAGDEEFNHGFGILMSAPAP
jgi:hypothetical protein